jgi:outer membrane protein assembly factor BamB
LFAAAILSVVILTALAACGPAPLGTSWAGLSLIGEANNILLSYNDRLVMIDPVEGKPVKLLNQRGEVRLDDQGNPRLWEVRGSGPNQFFASPVALDEDTLLVSTYNQVLHTIDIPTARIENTAGTPIPGTTGHIVADPVLDGDVIFFGLSVKNVIALDREDYRVLWTAETEHGVWSKPLLVDNVLYFSALDHYLYAVNARTGDMLWKLDLEGAAPSAPIYANGRLYIGSFGRKLFEISTSGDILSSYDTEDWVWGAPALVDGVLYAADLIGNVYALDARDNLREIWKTRAATSAIRPTPVVYDDKVIVASRDQKLYWLNRADGTQMTNADGLPLLREMQSPIFADVLLIEPNETTALAEPIVVVSTLSPAQMLVAYTVAEGRFLWAYAFQ